MKTSKVSQVDGNHYERLKIEPVLLMAKYHMNWFQGEILKYISRYPFKNGFIDLEKAYHISEMAINFHILPNAGKYYYHPSDVLDYIDQFKGSFFLSYVFYTEEGTNLKAKIIFDQLVLCILNREFVECSKLIQNLIKLEYGKNSTSD